MYISNSANRCVLPIKVTSGGPEGDHYRPAHTVLHKRRGGGGGYETMPSFPQKERKGERETTEKEVRERGTREAWTDPFFLCPTT